MGTFLGAAEQVQLRACQGCKAISERFCNRVNNRKAWEIRISLRMRQKIAIVARPRRARLGQQGFPAYRLSTSELVNVAASPTKT